MIENKQKLANSKSFPFDSLTNKDGNNGPPNKNLNLPPNKAYFLQRTQVLQEIQSELLTWGKRRFWFITIIVIVIGYFGGRTLIESNIDRNIRARIDKEMSKVEEETWQASKAAVIAKDATEKSLKVTEEYRASIEKAIAEANEYINSVELLRTRAENLDEQITAVQKILEENEKTFRTIQNKVMEMNHEQQQMLENFKKEAAAVKIQFLAVRQRLDGEQQAAIINLDEKLRRQLNDIRYKTDQLEKLILDGTQVSSKALNTFTEEIAKLEDEKLKEKEKFLADHSEYKVTIFFNEITKDISYQILNKIRLAGFKTFTLNKSLYAINRFSNFSSGGSTSPDRQWQILQSPFIPQFTERNMIQYTPDSKEKAKLIARIFDYLPINEKPILREKSSGYYSSIGIEKEIEIYLVNN